MAKLSKAKTSVSKQNGGVWVTWEDGMQFKIARAGNPVAVRLQDEYEANNRALREAGEPEVPFSTFSAKLMSEAILLDWRNVEDDNGVPIKYTPKEGAKIFTEPEFTDLAVFLSNAAMNRQHFKEQGEARTEKNSVPLSSQTSKSAETSGEHSKPGSRATTPDGEREPSAS